MYLQTLFTTDKIEHNKCSATGKWVNKLWNFHAVMNMIDIERWP